MRWPFSMLRMRRNTQIDRELQFHLDALIDANLERGMPPEEARRQAQLIFGGTEQAKQQVREVHLSAWVESLQANLRSALRFIRRSPVFTATIILTLTLGIGANSAVFAAIDAILLRPLPFPHAEELVRVHQLSSAVAITPEYFVAPLRLEDWNRMSTSFREISGYYTGDATLVSGAYPEKIAVAFVAPRFLDLWGVHPRLGRDFTEQEEKFGGPGAVLVSDRFWRSHLDADPAAAGKVIHLGSSAFTVVGILPASFLFADRDVDLWEPSAVDAPFAQNRESTWFTVIGRLKPGVKLAAAQAELASVQQQLGRQYGKTDANLRVSLEPLKSVVLGRTGRSLWLLYGSVWLLLLIACTNIASLLMARTAEREHEIAIRYALGASRPAIVMQLLSEVFLLALAGACSGLLLAALASHGFALVAKSIPRADEIVMNWRIVVYALGCAVVVTLACGLIPAFRGTRRALSGTMAQVSRTQVSGRSRWQWLLVCTQVALAVMLLTASGLLLRSYQAIGQVRPGFEASHVLTLRISAGWGETADMGKLTNRINRILDGIRAVPGVEQAATTSTIPGNSLAYPTDFEITEHAAGQAGDNARSGNEKMLADTRIVSEGYFQAMHVPLLQGEACTADGPSGSLLVNRSLAEKYFPDGRALGYHLRQATTADLLHTAIIRGIVGDVHEEGRETPVRPTVYWCFTAPTPDPYYVIRTYGDPLAMAETLRKTIHTIEPSRSVFDIVLLEDHLDDRQAVNRLRTILLSVFALTAIALVSIGLYGTISYLARTRRREVGLRLALGAMPRQIVYRFLFQGLRVAVAGCAIGLLAAAAMSHLLAGLLYGVSALDPATYVSVLMLTMTVALAASFVPSLRSARVDPTQMLREE